MALITAQYDDKIIKEFADQLYKKAANVLALYILGGIFITPFATFLIFKNPEASLFGLIAGLFIGIIMGKEKALKYKLEAQLALCQLQIEINTRPTQP